MSEPPCSICTLSPSARRSVRKRKMGAPARPQSSSWWSVEPTAAELPERSGAAEGPSAGRGRQAENVNRTGSGVMARDVDSAIAALSVSGRPEVDAHPERCGSLAAPALFGRPASAGFLTPSAPIDVSFKRSKWSDA